MVLLPVEDDVPLQGIHQADEVVHDARQRLLRVGRLLVGRLVGLFIQAYDVAAVAHVVDGLLGREEARPHAVVDVLALESYPVAFPSSFGRRVIGVPFAGKQHEDVAGLDDGLLLVGRAEHAFALGLIEQLILIQFAPFPCVEVVAVGMPLCRVGVSGLNLFMPHGAHGESPLCIAHIGNKIFAGLHRFRVW